MKVISQFALLCFTYQSLAAVASSDDIEDKLSELQAQFEELRSDLAGEQETFQKRYVSELEKLEAEAKTAGNLKLVLAIREEVEDFPTRKVPPTPSEFPRLARLQKIYTDETARILNNQKEKTATLFRSYLKQLNDLQTELTKAGKIDDAVKVLAEIENLKKAWPSVSVAPPTPTNPGNPTQPRLYQPGLVVAEYPRLETQKGSEGFVSYQDLIKLDPRPEKRHTKSLKAWGYSPNKNAVAKGYLKIEKPGDYVFNSNSFYDRNALYIQSEDRPLCRYRDGEGNKVMITLPAGMVRIISIGYVDARVSCRLQWQPPGQEGLSPIPEDLLFHSTQD